MYHDDIEGTRAKTHYPNQALKDVMRYKDIEGAAPKSQLVNKFYDTLDCSDINGPKKTVHRERDPLNPQYLYARPDGTVVTYGEIEGSKPKL